MIPSSSPTLAYMDKCSSPHMCHPSWASVLPPLPTCFTLKCSPPNMWYPSWAGVSLLCVSLPEQAFSSPFVPSYLTKCPPPPLHDSSYLAKCTPPHNMCSPNMSHYLGRCAPSPSPSPLPLPPEGARAASSSACAGATNTAGSRARPEALHADDDTHSGVGIHSINCMFL